MGLLQLNCTSEYNPTNPNDKNNIKCIINSDNYYYSNPSYTSSKRRKLQQDYSNSDTQLLTVWSKSNMQIHINDKLVFEGSGNTYDQPWNLLKVNPLVDTFSITVDRNCGWCEPEGFVAWLNGQAIDWSHFKCHAKETLNNWHW